MNNHNPPFIKEEHEHYGYNFMSIPQQPQQQQYHGQSSHHNMDMNSVDPSNLTMGVNSYGHNMAGSFMVGKAGITDDELVELGDFNDNHTQMPQNSAMFQHQHGGMPMNLQQQQQMQQQHHQQQQQQQMQQMQMYSHTPEGAPIMSPFQNAGFDYSQFAQGSLMQNGAMHKMTSQMTRHPSECSPMTPKIHNLHLGTPESGNFLQQHGHTQSNQWNGTPGSGSWLESPGPSPHQANGHHQGISETLLSGNHASLPAKMEGCAPVSYQAQEAKRRRRRESHNLVERRRRDNINERIHDLSKLVPQHRLDDEKIRKHITANGPLSPGLAATGISPPHATSLLAGGNGRRAAGGITQGLPPDEKDKGPNKGDILNSSVSWTRDLMWLLWEKIEQEKQLKESFAAAGRSWPFSVSEEERRMVSELTEAMQRNGAAQFQYSRYHGSGLRVPKHTNYAGEPVQGGADSPQSLSPGGADGSTPVDVWGGHHTSSDDRDNDQFSYKEEEEFGMEMEG